MKILSLSRFFVTLKQPIRCGQLGQVLLQLLSWIHCPLFNHTSHPSFVVVFIFICPFYVCFDTTAITSVITSRRRRSLDLRCLSLCVKLLLLFYQFERLLHFLPSMAGIKQFMNEKEFMIYSHNAGMWRQKHMPQETRRWMEYR